MKVIVIDDGINSSLYNIGSLYSSIEVLPNLNVTSVIVPKTIITHGTVCAGIIRKYSPSSQLCSIKIMSNDNIFTDNSKQLLKALEICTNYSPCVINISVGVEDMMCYFSFREVVSRLIKLGFIIIAAASNSNSYALPACLSGVISVKADSSLKDNEYYLNLKSGLLNPLICASGTHNIGYITKSCNSFAAPLITSLLANYSDEICQMPKLYQYIKHLFPKHPYISNIILPDFLNLPIIIGDKSIELYCKCSTKINEAELRTFEMNECSQVVVFPEINIDNFIIFVKMNKKYINAIVYNGIACNEIYNYIVSEGILFWDYSQYENILEENKNSTYYKNNISVIKIDTDIELQEVLSLNEQFIKEGYHSTIISDEPLILEHNIFYKPKQMLTKKMVTYFIEHWDVLLFYSDDREHNFIYDYFLFRHNSPVLDTDKNNIIYLDKNFNPQDIINRLERE